MKDSAVAVQAATVSRSRDHGACEGRMHCGWDVTPPTTVEFFFALLSAHWLIEALPSSHCITMNVIIYLKCLSTRVNDAICAVACGCSRSFNFCLHMLPTPEYIFNVQCTVVVCVWFPQMHKQDLFYCHSNVCFFILRSAAVKGKRPTWKVLKLKRCWFAYGTLDREPTTYCSLAQPAA